MVAYAWRIQLSYDLKLVDGDISIDAAGQIAIVKDEEKLIQDVLKLLFTSTGELAQHPWYGTALLTKVIGESVDPKLTIKEVSSSIGFGLNNLKQLQQLQQRDGQFLTNKELINSIQSINVKLDENDPRKMVISIELITKSNTVISESFVIKI